jgi:glycerol uptake facilitator protein
VHTAVLTGAQSGLWQVAIVWGLAITITIYIVGAMSGAHINPAISIALAMWGRFEWSRTPAYIGAQVMGAFLAAATLYCLYSPQIALKERELGVTRGQPESIVTAMCYGEYFPAPGSLRGPGLTASEQVPLAEFLKQVPHRTAFMAEVLGTAILALAIFAITDTRNSAAPPPALAPVFIGLTVAILISIIAPLTQACFNPARDFGPRLFASLAGWGAAAIPGPNGSGFFTVYIVAPTLGALLGGGLYEKLLRGLLPDATEHHE